MEQEDPVVTPVGIASADHLGVEGNGSSASPVFTPDGRSVVFVSSATNLVAGDTNGVQDVFIKDLAGHVTLVSADVNGVLSNGASYNPAISADGTKVAFSSLATNFAPADNNGAFGYDIFVKNLTTGIVTLVSAAADGTPGNDTSQNPVFSPDGGNVMFVSDSSNLAAGDTDHGADVFIKTLATGVVTLVSTNAAGLHGVEFGTAAAFSPDGTKVAFCSLSALTPGDANNRDDIFIKDLTTGALTLVSTNMAGVEGNNSSFSTPVFSPDGTKIAFGSTATNLVPGGSNATTALFVKDLTTGAVQLISTNSAGVQGDKTSFDPQFSPDGTKVVFDSYATNLVAGDTNNQPDIFVKDLTTGATTLISVSAAGTHGNNFSRYPAFSPDGSKITYQSNASNLVAGDTNAASDVIVTSFPLPPLAGPAITGASGAVNYTAGSAAVSLEQGLTVTDVGGTITRIYIVASDRQAADQITDAVLPASLTVQGVTTPNASTSILEVDSVAAGGAPVADAQAFLRGLNFTTPSGAGQRELGIYLSDPTHAHAPAADGTGTPDATTNIVVAAPIPPGGAGGGGGTPVTPPATSPSDDFAVEIANLSRARSTSPDALNPASPLYAQAQAAQTIASQYAAGLLTLSAAETALIHLVDGTTSVAVVDYAFFTGRTPSLAGLNYLVHSDTNPSDLNDTYYGRFNTENRYINFAVGLGTGGGPGAAAFAASYGAGTLADATAKAYVSIFGAAADAAKVDALLNTLVPNGLGGTETRAQYFAQYGGDGPNGIGTKAAMVGFLLADGVKEGIGVYGAADLHYLQALAHGAAPAFDTELALTYGARAPIVGAPVPDPYLPT